ncbi:MAG: hypothetical protein IPI67_13085 [Myxococcales bacterium]|nr:hypothetical protein [Myxococcales bacterium]
MSTDVVALLPEARWPSVLAVLELVRHWLPRSAEPVAEPAKNPLLQDLRQAALSTGAGLIGASSRDDLVARADEVIESDAFQNARLLMFELTRSLPLSSLEDAFDERPEPSDELVASLGVASARELLSGLAPLVKAGAAAYIQILSVLPTESVREAVAGSISCLSDERMPTAVRREILAAFRAEVFGFAIVAAVEQKKRLNPWLAITLVELMLSGELSRLRVLAAIPGITVPATVVPFEDRLDLAELELTARETTAAITSWADAAKASGDDPYFPFGASDEQE